MKNEPENELGLVLAKIAEEHSGHIQAGGRNYIEVDIAAKAAEMGFAALADRYRGVFAIVPLKSPLHGMKVRIDGRTFVGYRQYDSGVAVPGYVARSSALPSAGYAVQHSMICNFA